MILTVAMQKGGTGKTTTAAILAQAAARQKLKVLTIDLDPQRNLTSALGIGTVDPETGPGDAYKLITGERAIDQIYMSKQTYIDIVPGNDALATITTGPGSARRLQKALEPITAANVYDLVIIDTPPTAGELQYNAIQAADRLIIPLRADTYSAQGLNTIAENVKQIQQSNPGLTVAGILFTQYRQGSILEKQLFRAIINKAVGELNFPYLGTIRTCDKVTEAAALQESIYRYAPRCSAAADYADIFNEITNYQYT